MGDRVGASVLGSARSLVGWLAGAPSRALTAVRGLPAKATWTQKQPLHSLEPCGRQALCNPAQRPRSFPSPLPPG